jgi:prophage maintenance system killer protein
MPTGKFPSKKIGERMKKLKMEPAENYGSVENSVWYPNERFLEETHDVILRIYGGYTGYEGGLELFRAILSEVKQTKGIYKKAAILLRQLATTPRVYEDGNHRTALLTCETFLERNGKEIWTKNSQIIYKFIKDVLNYNIEEITEWLENGPKEARASD